MGSEPSQSFTAQPAEVPAGSAQIPGSSGMAALGSAPEQTSLTGPACRPARAPLGTSLSSARPQPEWVIAAKPSNATVHGRLASTSAGLQAQGPLQGRPFSAPVSSAKPRIAPQSPVAVPPLPLHHAMGLCSPHTHDSAAQAQKDPAEPLRNGAGLKGHAISMGEQAQDMPTQNVYGAPRVTGSRPASAQPSFGSSASQAGAAQISRAAPSASLLGPPEMAAVGQLPFDHWDHRSARQRPVLPASVQQDGAQSHVARVPASLSSQSSLMQMVCPEGPDNTTSEPSSGVAAPDRPGTQQIAASKLPNPAPQRSTAQAAGVPGPAAEQIMADLLPAASTSASEKAGPAAATASTSSTVPSQGHQHHHVASIDMPSQVQAAAGARDTSGRHTAGTVPQATADMTQRAAFQAAHSQPASSQQAPISSAVDVPQQSAPLGAPRPWRVAS